MSAFVFSDKFFLLFSETFLESQTFHSQSISSYVKAQDWRDGPRVLF